MIKDIEVNKFKKEKKGIRKRKRRKKNNKYLSVMPRYKTKRNIENIKKGIIFSKKRLNKSISNFKFIKRSEDSNSLINLPKINIMQSKNPMLKSFGDLNNNNEEKKMINKALENDKEKLSLNKIEIHNFKIKEKEKTSNEKIKQKLIKKVSIEKPKITINEALNDISSMNGGHTNNFTSKYLLEASKSSNNAFNKIIGFDTNLIVNVNIRKENKSISASVNKQNQNKNNRLNSLNRIKDENNNEKNELDMKRIKYFDDANNKRKYLNNNNINNILKSKTNIYFNLRNKRREELEKRFVKIRKEYKDKEYNQSIENTRSYIYLILPGNASYLIKNCMLHRVNWKEAFSSVTSLFNFKWQQLSFGIDYNSLGEILNTKQMVNHFENHFALTNKANMFINMMEYCEKRKISIFKYVPFTIIFKFKDKTNFENNNELKKKEIKRLEELKQFINNYKNYIVNYEEIGKFYEDENYKKEQMKRMALKLKVKKKLKKRKKEEEGKTDKNNINNDDQNKMKLYTDYFRDLKIKEKIPKIKKEKDGSYIPIEEKQNENIGKNTLIEIPNTHDSGNNLWIVKAINLNRGMCIRVVNSFEQIEETVKKFKEGVKFNFSRENEENKL